MESLNDDILLKYLRQECSDEEYGLVNAWLNQSEENLSVLFSLEEAFDAERSEKYSSEAFLNMQRKRLERKIEREKQRQRFKSSVNRILKYAAVAAVILTLGLGFYQLIPYLRPDKKEIMQASGASRKQLLLEDGTKVWLSQYTTIRYPESFGSNRREAFIEGEAYFEVSTDRKRPFVVHTEALQVTALGTSFNLKSLKNEEIAETSLIEGIVEVKSKEQGGQIVLSPGQKAELNKRTKQLSVKQVNAKLDAVWHNDLIPFENARLSDISHVLERFYDVTIVLAPNLDSCTYSGVIHKRESVDSVLNALQHSIPIRYKIIQSKVFINRAAQR